MQDQEIHDMVVSMVAVAPGIVGLLLVAAAAALGYFVFFGPVHKAIDRAGAKKSNWDAAAIYLQVLGLIMLLVGAWYLLGSTRTRATLLMGGRSICIGCVAELFAVHIRMRLPRSRLWFFFFGAFIVITLASVSGWQDLLDVRELMAVAVISLTLPIAGLLILEIIGHIRERRHRRVDGQPDDGPK